MERQVVPGTGNGGDGSRSIWRLGSDLLVQGLGLFRRRQTQLLKQGFLAQLAFGQPVPTAFEMGLMWVPTSDHLERIYNTGSQPSAALIDTELAAAQAEIVADIATARE